MRTANERRQEMIELLCERRHETLTNLADYFNVSKQTVCSDIAILTLSYPLETKCGRHDGGVYVAEGYYIGKQYLTDEQEKVLQELTGTVNEEQAKILQSIISKFGSPTRMGGRK